MTKSIEEIEALEGFFGKNGRSGAMIEDAERALGARFSNEYRSYLEKYGLASANGHELTGICDSPRLNVVSATLKERAYHSDISSQLYVIERVGIDDIVAWQDEAGRIYETIGQSNPEVICESLIEYISR